jgi:hypothetical protein
MDDHFHVALLVFIRVTRSSLSVDPAKPFGFDCWRLVSGFPLLLTSNSVSPRLFHLQPPVKKPVSVLDCEAILHPKKTKSSRKYFNLTHYLTTVCGNTVDKCRLMPVNKNVENTATDLNVQVT